MKVALTATETVLTGRAIDLTAHDVDPAQLAEALESDAPDEVAISIECPPPGAVHAAVGVISPDMTVDRRTTLAAVARSVGLTAPQDEDIAALEAELSALDPPAVDTEPARRRLAAVGAEHERLRERVARLQGRVTERRDAGLPTDAVDETLTEAIRTLSEVETERVAARQALAAVREEARAARDKRERRLSIADELGNRRRAAREHLATEIRPDMDAAVAAAPGDAMAVDQATPQTVALAAGRVAAMDAPLILVDPPFADPSTAADWLGTPVIEV